jgi:hypothetical protein
MIGAFPTEGQLIEQFLDPLRALPDVRAELGTQRTVGLPGEREVDAQIDINVAGKLFTLLVEAKNAVYPRDVRQVVWQLRDFSRNRPAGESDGGESISLLLAESISPGAKDLLKNEDVGYYDSGGSLYLPAPGA